MTELVQDLSRLLSIARSWVGRDLETDEIGKLMHWLDTESQNGQQNGNQIDQGLAAASAVIAEGRMAAEAAMADAFKSVRGQTEPGAPPPPPPLQERVASTEQKVLEKVLQGGVSPPEGLNPQESEQLAQVAQQLTEVIRVQVNQQVELRMIEADAQMARKLTEMEAQMMALCNVLSSEIRQQMARDLTSQAPKRAPQKKS